MATIDDQDYAAYQRWHARRSDHSKTLFRVLMGLSILAFVFFFGLVNLAAIKEKLAGPISLFATQAPTTKAAATPTIIIPRSSGPSGSAGASYTPRSSAPGGAPAGSGGAAPAATPTPTATPAACVLTTWPDGSQSCDDGRHIDEAHSQPGYCKPVVWGDGSVSCNDGKPSGKVIWADPEVQSEPTPTPWPAAPTNDVQWAASDGPNGNTCVTVTFGDGHTQTACSDANVQYDADDAAFVARMIQDGRIAPGNGGPKG
jgi:diadenosine tetraphosphatase ApaH/serine/threonine PP2A family protein phosphatase